MNTLILSTKVFLISAGVLSLAMGIKFSVPWAVNGIPALWSVISLWLKPPYLYIIINGIIITIAATSRFQFHHGKSEPSSDHHSSSVKPSFPPPPPSEPTIMLYENRVEEEEDMVVELKPVIVNGAKVDFISTHHQDEEEIIVAESEGGDVFIDQYSYDNNDDYESANDLISTELELESLFPVREKPLISTRFGHRKPTRTTPTEVSGVRRLGVARPKKHDTLESTWKAITEGRHVPLTRHMKKSSETMEHHHHVAPDHVLISETFNDRTSFESRIAKIRKEPSLGQEELNRRVEAFIKKFNDDMRMQRQESLNQYMEMINRGV